MNILLLRGFNNYFNRIVKKCSTIADYKAKSNSYLELENINFNPNDGIATELVIGSPNQLEDNKPLAWDQVGTPDYLVCYENEGDPAVPVIKFRWFILESERTRTGQYHIALKRDVIAEHFDEVMNSPCYVEKGIIRDQADPLICNSEGTVVNQIKKAETPLKDESESAWLVGYLKKGFTGETVSATMVRDLEDALDATSLYFKDYIQYPGQSTTNSLITIGSSWSKLWFTMFQRRSFELPSWNNFYLDMVWGTWYKANFDGDQFNASYNGTNSAIINEPHIKFNDMSQEKVASIMSTATDDMPEATKVAFLTYMLSSLKTNHNLSELSDLSGADSDYTTLVRKYNNATIVKDGVYYKLAITIGAQSYNDSWYNYNSDTSIGNFFDWYVSKLNAKYSGFSKNTDEATANKLGSRIYYNKINIIATKLDTSGDAVTVTIPDSNHRIVTEDALYDIFAIPYIPEYERDQGDSPVKFRDSNGALRTIDPEAMLFIAQQIATKLGTGDTNNGWMYDLQVLPYCPIKLPSTTFLNNTTTDLRKLDSKSFVEITQDSVPIGYMVFAQKSNFTKDIVVNKKITSRINRNATYNFTEIYPELVSGTYTIESKLVETPPIRHWEPVVSLNDGEEIKSVEIYVDDVKKDDAIFTLGHQIPVSIVGLPATYRFSVTNIVSDVVPTKLTLNLIIEGDGDATPIDVKISNECDFLRLTSPNYNGMFEFKLSKLAEQQLNFVNVDCSYKPVCPYIKLNPDFSGLYGADWNDSTGLILGGDFSLPVLNDQWINYQLNNKNYQAIFNRQIENIDITQQIATEQMNFQNTIGIITGPVGGAVGGAVTGAKAGPWGAVAGAVAGGVGGGILAGVGAQKNADWLARQQGEAKDYMIDMYNYQLGNIKALPQTITKSDPLTYNNKIWPILEEFSCTDAEKTVLKNKIKYNSMTIMAIGSLSNYAVSSEFDKVYVKGQLIRNETIDDDFHIVDAIYQEVNKGFYVPQK